MRLIQSYPDHTKEFYFGERHAFPNRSLVQNAAKVRFEPILLKNCSLLAGPFADSILLEIGRVCDDGTKAGSAGGTVL